MHNFHIKLLNFSACVILSLMFLGDSVEPIRADSAPFHFETINSLDDMQHFIEAHFSLGSSQQSLRKIFVDEGGATLKTHPTQIGVEKYIYDINLCSYYIWRWNVSANYDSKGRLLQAYIDGNPVFAGGTPKKDPKNFSTPSGKKASIYKMKRPRPEANKGEKELAFIMMDADSDIDTIDDQVLMGGGPSRVDPINMGKLITYQNVEPWRSIFDFDEANHIEPYSGDCSKADGQ